MRPRAGHVVRAAVLTAATVLGCGRAPVRSKADAAVVPTRQLDLLFLVDSSSGPEKAQENLRANLPRLLDVLKNVEGRLPDLHAAVITSDLGIGSDQIPGCNSTGGNRGEFQFGVGQGAVGCTETGLAAGATFVRTTGGADPVSNFTGDVTQVLQCLLPVGTSGCGFEQPLASLVRALGADGAPAPGLNQQFLRDDAVLAIVMLTDEDDCSARDVGFYDVTTNTDLTSLLGPPGNFRCNEFGHLCNGMAPNRFAPHGLVTDVEDYVNCVSNDLGRLKSVAGFAAQIEALKTDPARVVVASIQGPPAPYRVRWKMPAVTGDGPWPMITSSCTATDGGFADPSVRLHEFATRFGESGLEFSVCDVNFGPALETIGHKIAETMGLAFIPPTDGGYQEG